MPATRLIAPLMWWKLVPAAGVILLAVALSVVVGPVFTTPQVGATLDPVPGPTAIMSSLLIAFAIAGTLKEPVSVLPRTAMRRVRVWRYVRVLGLLILSTLLLTLAVPDTATAALSCVCAFSGEALLFARLLWEEIAWAAPLLHGGLTLTFGADSFGNPHAWAWILQPQPTGTALASSALLLTVGIVTWGQKPPT